MTTLTRRLATVAAALAIGVGALTACSSDNVDCTTNACTVTFDRGVEAESSVLGVDVKLVGVDNGVVKVDVGGTTVSVPVDGSTQAQGFDITVQKVTDSQVVIRVQTS
ncbi:hypothetical protein Daura_35625 [Dactylosporangium aurantiacum]|uniref:Lipoprotein n=1 Tax=Dactylosporangium aurantiacum TaxID=35754 RepID=A0A9Q9MJK5_9ACTN|nr:hypothetical protein [Dactylosporangium aurantiacum]MDG6103497.1 hypothetical protein [Dactylosporangium aurantiacum]UWZ52002.1 hypothetical protein Daura_35625 [Dactylosporangium aurantiacum]